MVKTQVYFDDADLKELHRIARRRKRRVADMIREAVRTTWLSPRTRGGLPGPVAIWSGKSARPGTEHDSIYDER